jgi:prepilin-type N-terminal cleavage/methylation domain-containing protein
MRLFFAGTRAPACSNLAFGGNLVVFARLRIAAIMCFPMRLLPPLHHYRALTSRAFSLVELVVVVTIMAALLAMILPSMEGAAPGGAWRCAALREPAPIDDLANTRVLSLRM